MAFDWNCFWAGSSRLSSFEHHVLGYIKLDAQEKLC